jgi:hypothetical protein
MTSTSTQKVDRLDRADLVWALHQEPLPHGHVVRRRRGPGRRGRRRHPLILWHRPSPVNLKFTGVTQNLGQL